MGDNCVEYQQRKVQRDSDSERKGTELRYTSYNQVPFHGDSFGTVAAFAVEVGPRTQAREQRIPRSHQQNQIVIAPVDSRLPLNYFLAVWILAGKCFLADHSNQLEHHAAH